MKRSLVLLPLAGLLLVALARAVPASDYRFHDGYYWRGNDAYVRTQYYHPGYYSCGYYYQPYYTYDYSYDHTYAAPQDNTPKVPTYSADWKSEVVKYAQARDDYATFLKALDALGAKGQVYPFQVGYQSAYQVYGSPAVAYGSAGATQYGYSYKQVADYYGALDLNATFQQAARAGAAAQEATVAANQLFSERQKEAISAQARVAEVLAEAEATKRKLDAARPEPSAHVETSVQGAGAGNVAAPSGTGVAASSGMDEAAFLRLRTDRCGACHGAKDPKAKLDLTGPWSRYSAQQRAEVLAAITTTDLRKHMPQTGDGKPAQLPADEVAAFARYCLQPEGGKP